MTPDTANTSPATASASVAAMTGVVAPASAACASTWVRFWRGLPLTLALLAVAGVWLAGAVWSFEEQTRYAASRGFTLPWLLPLVLDGLAVSLAGVAYAAALDGRPAVQARVMTAVAVIASAASNGAWAWTRTAAASPTGVPDPGAVVLAVGVPVASILAFEVLLGELRRQVHRRRGQPAPVAVPAPRLVRLVLSPWGTFRQWRATVLAVTAPATTVTVTSIRTDTRSPRPTFRSRLSRRRCPWKGTRAAPAAPVTAAPSAPAPTDTTAPSTTSVVETTGDAGGEVGWVTCCWSGGRWPTSWPGRLPLTRRSLLAGLRARPVVLSDRAGALLRALRAHNHPQAPRAGCPPEHAHTTDHFVGFDLD